ncbi:MAG: glycosyltransferase [Candidatus Dojkabacteria bacterium]|nr:glycosyltransferase [Candidatus Dojkabacteria bacterium]
MNPTISTYITTFNSLFYQSTIEQTIRQALLFSDEIIVVNSKYSTDGTQNLLDQLKLEYPNIIKLYTFKEDYSIPHGKLADKKTFALRHCTSDYCILQDDDEVIHEQYANYIRQLPLICPDTLAFKFNTLHFYRSYNNYQPKHSDWYDNKIYMVKNIPEITHGKVNSDPDNHIISSEINNTIQSIPLNSLHSPEVINTPVTSYHYGWANRNDAILLLKKYYQEIRWWGKDYWKTHEFPFKFEDSNKLPKFTGTHPKYMIPIIEQEQRFNSKHIKEFSSE